MKNNILKSLFVVIIATLVVVTAVYAATTVGTNISTDGNFTGTTATFTLPADGYITIDAMTTTHTDDSNAALTLGLAPGAEDVTGLMIYNTLMGDYGSIFSMSSILVGVSTGHSSGDAAANYHSILFGDDDDTAYVYRSFVSTANDYGGNGTMVAYYAGTNHDVLMHAYSGNITFQGYTPTIGTSAGQDINFSSDNFNFTGNVDVTGNIETNGDITSSDTGDIGWTMQSAANQACNTTCVNACVFGFDDDNDTSVACDDVAADKCLCAGSS